MTITTAHPNRPARSAIFDDGPGWKTRPESHPSNRCEQLLASIPAHFDLGDEATLTLRGHQAGTIDLSRLLIFVSAFEAMEDQRTRLLDQRATVTSILIFNSHQKTRGLGHVRLPAGSFSPLRRHSVINLKKIRLAADDTVAITLRVTPLLNEKPGRRVVAGAVAPLVVDGWESLGREPGLLDQRQQYLASAGVRSHSQEPFHLVLSPEEDGAVDLASLQIGGAVREPAKGVVRDALPTTLIESIRLPSGHDLVVGNSDCFDQTTQTVLAAPTTMFQHLDRARHWFYPGILRVTRGQQITIRMRHLSGHELGPEAIFNAGIRYYPASPPGDSRNAEAKVDFFPAFD